MVFAWKLLDQSWRSFFEEPRCQAFSSIAPWRSALTEHVVPSKHLSVNICPIRFYPKFCGEFVGEICEISGHQLFVGLSNRRGTRKALAPSMPWTPHALRAAGGGSTLHSTRTSWKIQIDIPTKQEENIINQIVFIIIDTCLYNYMYNNSYIIAIMMYW